MFISMIQSGLGAASVHQSNSRNTGPANASFQASLQLHIAEMEAHAFNTLMLTPSSKENSRSESSSTALDALLTKSSGSFNGRNTALFDPESAYRMMTTINSKDVSYKAEYSKMSEMKSYVSGMQEAAKKLDDIDATASSDDISATLQTFADAYNQWIDRFDQDIAPGGILHGTRAAQVSQWELEQSIKNMFNGATDGQHGMPDLGFSVDPTTHQVSVDSTRLNSVLAANKTGVINTVREFSANFAKSADLLNSDNNFISNRLDNLSRVIDYIDTNKPSLQAEFGRGDEIQATGLVAKALAAYASMKKPHGNLPP